jgi:aryl-alcohol dehydrogenase-like predicted oxidoreductase
MQKENVPSIVIGVKTMEQLQDNLGALGWTLSDEEMSELDKVYAL